MKLFLELEIDLEKSGIDDLYLAENEQEIAEGLLLHGYEEEALHIKLLSYEYANKGGEE